MIFPLVTLAVLAAGIPLRVGLRGADAARLAVVHPLQRARRRQRDAAGSARSGRRCADSDAGRGWRTLYLPAVFPYLVTGLITAAGGAWNASIVAEYVRYRGETLIAPGLGSLITTATAAAELSAARRRRADDVARASSP